MKISRDPNEPDVESGGSYVGNFNNWRITLDGEKLNTRDILSADEENGEVRTMHRYPDSGKIVMDKGVPRSGLQHGLVVVEGRLPACTGCSRKNQQRRKTQAWWLL